jgi:hypothetical protein
MLIHKKKNNQMSNDKPFQWTTDLVKEFCEWAIMRIDKKPDISTQLYYLVEDFEASHSIDVKNEPTVISHLRNHDSFKGNGADAYWYQFCSSKPIPKEKNNNIANAIEFTLNNEPKDVVIGGHTFKFQEVPTNSASIDVGRDGWEIVEYFAKGYLGNDNVYFKRDRVGNFVATITHPIVRPFFESEERLKDQATIHSVLRVKDSVQFSVGDECKQGEIKSFFIGGKDNNVRFYGKLYMQH